MADLSDVQNELVSLIAGAMYPGGVTAPSVCNCPIQVYAGWPDTQRLVPALAGGEVHISIWPGQDKVTRIPAENWTETSNNGTTGTAERVVREQTRQFQITVWAGQYGLRDAAAGAVDVALAATSRLSVCRGTLRYLRSIQDDAQQKSGIYRRDLFYMVEYQTVQTATYVAIRRIDVVTTPNGSIEDAFTTTTTGGTP